MDFDSATAAFIVTDNGELTEYHGIIFDPIITLLMKDDEILYKIKADNFFQ